MGGPPLEYGHDIPALPAIFSILIGFLIPSFWITHCENRVYSFTACDKFTPVLRFYSQQNMERLM